VQADAVLDGETGRHAVGDGTVVLLAPGRLCVVVDAVRVGQKGESPDRAGRAVEGA